MGFFVLRNTDTNLYQVVEGSSRAAVTADWLSQRRPGEQQPLYVFALGRNFSSQTDAQNWLSRTTIPTTKLASRPALLDLTEGRQMLERIRQEQDAEVIAEQGDSDSTAEADGNPGDKQDELAERDKPLRPEKGDTFKQSTIIPADQPQPLGRSVWGEPEDLPPNEAAEASQTISEMLGPQPIGGDNIADEMVKRTVDMLSDDLHTAPLPPQIEDLRKAGYFPNPNKGEWSPPNVVPASKTSYERSAELYTNDWTRTPGKQEVREYYTDVASARVVAEARGGKVSLFQGEQPGSPTLAVASYNIRNSGRASILNPTPFVRAEYAGYAFATPGTFASFVQTELRDKPGKSSETWEGGPKTNLGGITGYWHEANHPTNIPKEQRTSPRTMMTSQERAALSWLGDVVRPDAWLSGISEQPLTQAEFAAATPMSIKAQQQHQAARNYTEAYSINERSDSRSFLHGGFGRPIESGGFGPESSWNINPNQEDSWNMDAVAYDRNKWSYQVDQPGMTPFEMQRRAPGALAEDYYDAGMYGGRIDSITGFQSTSPSASLMPAGFGDDAMGRPEMFSSYVEMRVHSRREAWQIARQRAGHAARDPMSFPRGAEAETIMYRFGIEGMPGPADWLATTLGAEVSSFKVSDIANTNVGRIRINGPRGERQEGGDGEEYAYSESTIQGLSRDRTRAAEQLGRRTLAKGRVGKYVAKAAAGKIDRVRGYKLVFGDLTSPTGEVVINPLVELQEGPLDLAGKDIQWMKATTRTARGGTLQQEGYHYFNETTKSWTFLTRNKSELPAQPVNVLIREHATKTVYVQQRGGRASVSVYDATTAQKVQAALIGRGVSPEDAKPLERAQTVAYTVNFYNKEYDQTGARTSEPRPPELGIGLVPEQRFTALPTAPEMSGYQHLSMSPASTPTAAAHALLSGLSAESRTFVGAPIGAAVAVTKTNFGSGFEGPVMPGYVVANEFTGPPRPLGTDQAHTGVPLHVLAATIRNPAQEAPLEDPNRVQPYATEPAEWYMNASGHARRSGYEDEERLPYEKGTSAYDNKEDLPYEARTSVHRARARQQTEVGVELYYRNSMRLGASSGISATETHARAVLGSIPGSDLMTGHLGRAAIGYGLGAALGSVLGFSSQPDMSTSDKIAEGVEGAMWGIMGASPRAIMYGLRSQVQQQTRDQIDATLVTMAVGIGVGGPLSEIVERRIAKTGRPALGQIAGFATGAAIWAAASLANTAFLAFRASTASRNVMTAAALATAADRSRELAESAEDDFEGLEIEFQDEQGDMLEADFDSDERSVTEVFDDDGEDLDFSLEAA